MKFEELIVWRDDCRTNRHSLESGKILADPMSLEMALRFEAFVRDELTDDPAQTGTLLAAFHGKGQALLEWQQIEPTSALATFLCAGRPYMFTLYLYGFDPAYDEAAIEATEILLRRMYPNETWKQFGTVRALRRRPAAVVVPIWYGAMWETSQFIDQLSRAMGVVFFRRAAAFVDTRDAGWKERGYASCGLDGECLTDRFSLAASSRANDPPPWSVPLVAGSEQAAHVPQTLTIRPLCSQRTRARSEMVGAGWSVPCDPTNRPRRRRGQRYMRRTMESVTATVSQAEALTAVAVHFLNHSAADVETAIRQAFRDIAALDGATHNPQLRLQQWLCGFPDNRKALDVLDKMARVDPAECRDEDIDAAPLALAVQRHFSAVVNEHGGDEETRRQIQNTPSTSAMTLVRQVRDKSLLTWALRRIAELVKQ